MDGIESTVFLGLLSAWCCFTVYGSCLTVQGDRLTLAMGMYAVAAVFGICALFLALNLHHLVADNGDQVASVSKSVGKFGLSLSGLVAMTAAILSNAGRRTRIALAAYSLAMLASTPLITGL